jgi:hypothetical protein
LPKVKRENVTARVVKRIVVVYLIPTTEEKGEIKEQKILCSFFERVVRVMCGGVRIAFYGM